ncbi:MAG: hypothetical protein NT155_03650 [Candidatus Staskawiczbacteria bacterium]|nr:hypothetical protein [Candidatus Staskawiczbacteria bacterium]
MVFKPGDKRPKGAGIKRGQKTKKTLEQEAALDLYKKRILDNLVPFIRAQFNQAEGMTVMFQRRKQKNKKTGKFERTGELVRVMDINRVEQLLKSDGQGENYYYITTKDPNVKALENLFNRVFGKPKESIEVEHKGSKVIILD